MVTGVQTLLFRSEYEALVPAGDDGLAELHDPLHVQHDIVIRKEDPAGFSLVIDHVQIGHDPFDGKGPEAAAVHVAHAAEVAAPGAAPGCFQHLAPLGNDVVAPGQAALIASGGLMAARSRFSARGLCRNRPAIL